MKYQVIVPALLLLGLEANAFNIEDYEDDHTALFLKDIKNKKDIAQFKGVRMLNETVSVGDPSEGDFTDHNEEIQESTDSSFDTEASIADGDTTDNINLDNVLDTVGNLLPGTEGNTGTGSGSGSGTGSGTGTGSGISTGSGTGTGSEITTGTGHNTTENANDIYQGIIDGSVSSVDNALNQVPTVNEQIPKYNINYKDELDKYIPTEEEIMNGINKNVKIPSSLTSPADRNIAFVFATIATVAITSVIISVLNT